MFHHRLSPTRLSPQHLYPVSPCSSHSPTGTEEHLTISYESADESSCEGHEVLDEEMDCMNVYRCFPTYRVRDLSCSPPTVPIGRQRSHTYCGPELPRLPFMSKNFVERCHSNDALWSRMNDRGSSHLSTSGELYETASSLSSSSSSTHQRKSLSRSVPDEDQGMKGCTGLRRALSALSLRLLQGEKERPVQRILRAPRKRQTVRGLSGLPIDSVNQWSSVVTMSG
ncbi:uncharacterized protein [Palaemon carinicauda]|uniref:uncharacterized protein n=1 Tax=Palaemon carinicauda TaxID=392227 RepID=UPI0035B60DB1